MCSLKTRFWDCSQFFIGIFEVVSLFSYQGSFLVFQGFAAFLFLFFTASAKTILSLRFAFVNNFFSFFKYFFKSFLQPKNFVSAVGFHTTILFPALSTTFYIYFSKHLQWHKSVKKEISIS